MCQFFPLLSLCSTSEEDCTGSLMLTGHSKALMRCKMWKRYLCHTYSSFGRLGRKFSRHGIQRAVSIGIENSENWLMLCSFFTVRLLKLTDSLASFQCNKVHYTWLWQWQWHWQCSFLSYKYNFMTAEEWIQVKEFMKSKVTDIL